MKGCPICKRDDVAVLNRLLARGRSPRGIAQGAHGLNRKQLTRHRDVCLGEKPIEEEASREG